MKKRADVLLAENGLCASREKAHALIMEGLVYVADERVAKCGDMFAEDTVFEIRGEQLRYVSRGGLKLEKAIDEFDISLEGRVCADIGASTGGFSDCMLQNGASRVYAVDVGYGQLAWKVRSDPRVVCLERQNARFLNSQLIPDNLDFVSVDVSFISLKLIIPAFVPLLSKDASTVMLIKPQFEAGREKVGKNGVVRDADTHIEVIKNVLTYARDNGLCPAGLTFSPIRGPKGNIEYLLYCTLGLEGETPDVRALVENAHSLLKVEK